MNKYRIVLTTSLVALGGWMLAETIDVSREQPINSAELPESRVNDEMARTLTINPLLKPNEEVVLEEAGVSSANGSWALTEGTLTAFEVPILDSVGDFNVTITAPVKIKAGAGKGNSNAPLPSGWTGTAIGNYKIKKCTNNFNNKPIILSAFKPPEKPYKCLETSAPSSFIYSEFSCPVDSSKTWSHVDSALPRYGDFLGPQPLPLIPSVMIDSTYQCGVCKTSNFIYHAYIVDWEFPNTELRLYKWLEADSAGPLTRHEWKNVCTAAIEHEMTHRDTHYKINVLDSIRPWIIQINICSNNDPVRFSKKDEIISNTLQHYENESVWGSLRALTAYYSAAEQYDECYGENGLYMYGSTRLTD